MANLPESASFDAGIYQIETTDPVLGGVDGISNAQAKGLANRTTWLKQQVDALNALKGKGVQAHSTGSSYAGGDQVIYQKNIWQANTAITPGAFNPANWTKQLGTAAASELADALPLMDGAAATGTSTDLAREDHVHPTDTSRAPLSSPAFTDNPSAPTPPPFDNDTSIATTAFVQRALGNRQDIKSVLTTGVLSAADCGKIIQLNNASTYIVTLPAVASLASGATYCFWNNGTAPVTVKGNGAEQINLGFSSNNTVSIQPGDTLEIASFGTLWLGIGGTTQLSQSAGIFKSSLTGNGYQKLPSGLIIQWGSLYTSATPAAASPVIFPTTFPSAVRSLSLTGGGESPASLGVCFDSQTTSGFNARAEAASQFVMWIAIGY